MITNIPLTRTCNKKFTGLGELQIDDKSVILPYMKRDFVKWNLYNTSPILERFNYAKKKFKPEIKNLGKNELDMFVKGMDFKDTKDGTGFLSYISDKKTGMTHILVQKYDEYDNTPFSPFLPPSPFTVIQKTVEKAFEVLKERNY